ncbi:hypothetical protein ACFL2R_01670 [Patescibacteria group bacterium]
MGKIFGFLKRCVIVATLTVFIIGVLFTASHLIGHSFVRNYDGRIETPVVFYEHPTTKRKIVFVATVHVAEKKYYSRLQEIVASLDGYSVLFEMVSPLSKKEKEGLGEVGVKAYEKMQNDFSIIRHAVDIMQLQYQTDGIVYDSSWVNTDISMYELISSMDEPGNAKKFCLPDDFEEEELKWLINFAARNIEVMYSCIRINNYCRSFFEETKSVVVGGRNEVAVQGIKEYLEQGNVVTIWGAAHFPGIDAQIRQMGFREIRREWISAYQVRGYSFFDLF